MLLIYLRDGCRCRWNVGLTNYRLIFKRRSDCTNLVVSFALICSWGYTLTLNIDLERSTHMFEQLADPNGANNPLSQVLYGLALR